MKSSGIVKLHNAASVTRIKRIFQKTYSCMPAKKLKVISHVSLASKLGEKPTMK